MSDIVKEAQELLEAMPARGWMDLGAVQYVHGANGQITAAESEFLANSARFVRGLLERIQELELEVIAVKPLYSRRQLEFRYDLNQRELETAGQTIAKQQDLMLELSQATAKLEGERNAALQAAYHNEEAHLRLLRIAPTDGDSKPGMAYLMAIIGHNARLEQQRDAALERVRVLENAVREVLKDPDPDSDDDDFAVAMDKLKAVLQAKPPSPEPRLFALEQEVKP